MLKELELFLIGQTKPNTGKDNACNGAEDTDKSIVCTEVVQRQKAPVRTQDVSAVTSRTENFKVVLIKFICLFFITYTISALPLK
jgi:hypothetical protein